RVVVHLGQRVAVAVLLAVVPLLRDNGGVRLGRVPFEPGGERWPEIEADPAEVAQLGIGAVALGRDLLVEVAVRGSLNLTGLPAREWIFTRGLIEVPVNREVFRIAASHDLAPHAIGRCAAGDLLKPRVIAQSTSLPTASIVPGRTPG